MIIIDSDDYAASGIETLFFPGGEHFLYKTPKTDDGTKNSARGLLTVTRDDRGKLRLNDCLLMAEYNKLSSIDLMRPVWDNGKFLNTQTLADVRKEIRR